MGRKIRVGCRSNVLAIEQARLVMAAIQQAEPDFEVQLITMPAVTESGQVATTSQPINSRQAATESIRNAAAAGQSSRADRRVLVRNLEQALAASEIDIAVHNYADYPNEMNNDLPIVALSRREAANDVLVLPEGVDYVDTARPVGTDNLRRSVQLLNILPDTETKPIRGNTITRLARLDLGEYSALVLSQAELIRLGLASRISRAFTISEMIPAGSQGIIAVQARLDENCFYLSDYHSNESEVVSLAERQFLKTLAAFDQSTVAVYGELLDGMILLRGLLISDHGVAVSDSLSARPEQAVQLGEQLATSLMEGLSAN